MRKDYGHRRNLLLESIAKECGLAQWIESVRFPADYAIVSPGQALKYFYFPVSGVLTTMVHLSEGAAAETLTIGSEGMVGVPIWLGVMSSLESVLQRIPGEILRIPARIFCKQIIGHRHTERLIKRFTAYSLRFSSQRNLCNAHHDSLQKTCRWLLSTSDRIQSLTLKVTQSWLAHMLGVRRQSVTQVAGELQSAGIIDYRRGEVQILDRKRVEALSCECYWETKGLYESLVRPAL